MKKEIPEIRESLSELHSHLRHERGARRRTRLQVLYLLKSGQAHTRQEVAVLVAVHRHTVGRWLDSYEQGGLTTLLAMHTHSNRRPILSAPVRQALKKKLQAVHGFVTYGQVQQWLQKRHGVSIKYKTLHRLVRYQLQAKLKVPRSSHVKKTPQQSRRFVPPLVPSSNTGRTKRGHA
jgi:transposase